MSLKKRSISLSICLCLSFHRLQHKNKKAFFFFFFYRSQSFGREGSGYYANFSRTSPNQATGYVSWMLKLQLQGFHLSDVEKRSTTSFSPSQGGICWANMSSSTKCQKYEAVLAVGRRTFPCFCFSLCEKSCFAFNE